VPFVIENLNGYIITINTYKLPSKHNRLIIIYYFKSTCFKSFESLLGHLMKLPKTI